MRWRAVVVTALMMLSSWAFIRGAGAQQSADDPAPELEGVDIVDHAGETVPLDLTFRNEAGETVRLGDYFNQDRPVILQLVYFSCPMLCTQVLNNYLASAQKMDWGPGKEYTVVTVSFDPRDKPDLAAAKKKNYIKELDKPGAADGWHFLTGEEPQIQALTGAVGFGYHYDEKLQQYAHAAGIFVLTSDGKISRTLYGIEYPPKDLKLSLVEASEGKLGSPVDKVLLYCFHYDPATHKYSLVAINVMKLGGLVTLIALGGFLGVMWMRERHRSGSVAA